MFGGGELFCIQCLKIELPVETTWGQTIADLIFRKFQLEKERFLKKRGIDPDFHHFLTPNISTIFEYRLNASFR